MGDEREGLRLARHRRITQLQNNGMTFAQAHTQAQDEQLEEALARVGQLTQERDRWREAASGIDLVWVAKLERRITELEASHRG